MWKDGASGRIGWMELVELMELMIVLREKGGGSEGGGCVGVFIRIKSGKIKPME